MDWQDQVMRFLVEEAASHGFRWLVSILVVAVLSLVIGGRRWLRGEVLLAFVSGRLRAMASNQRTAAFGVRASLAEISELSKQLEGKTELAADALLQPHLGKRLTVSGPLIEAEGKDTNVAAVTIRQPHESVAVLLFWGQAKNLEVLVKGQTITASGDLRELKPYDFVRLDNCQMEQ